MDFLKYLLNTGTPNQFGLGSRNIKEMLKNVRTTLIQTSLNLHDWFQSYNNLKRGFTSVLILPSGGVTTRRFCYQWAYLVYFDSR